MDESVRAQLGNTFIGSQKSGDFAPFNALLDQYNVSRKDLLSAFPDINQQGINEFVGRGVQFPLYQSGLIKSLRNASPAAEENPGLTMFENAPNGTAVGRRMQVGNNLFNPTLSQMPTRTAPPLKPFTNDQIGQSIFESYQQGYKLPQIESGLQSQYGIKPQQFNEALDDRLGQAIFESYDQGFAVPVTRQGAAEKLGATDEQFNSALDKRLAQAISESIAQGFDVNLTRQGATSKLGVSDADFDRALAIYNAGLV
jgi:hypothetical protein